MPRNSSQKATIRLAKIDDLAALYSLCQQCSESLARHASHPPFVFPAGPRDRRTTLRERALDRCLLLAERQGGIRAAAGIDLDRGALGELMISGGANDEGLLASLVEAAERRAVQFGLQTLNISLLPENEDCFRSLGFTVSAARAEVRTPSAAAPMLCMQRSLRRRQTSYARRVRTLCDELGIPPEYGSRHRLTLQPEASQLVSVGVDIFGREQQLRPNAAKAWNHLRKAAIENGVEMQTVSAWRSVDYQVEVLQRKLKKGLPMTEILRTSAAPGFSEHHTGLALDITTPAYPALEEEFEDSPAFRWMERYARDFGFSLSFPRNNRHLLAYEPWHWRFGE